MRETIKILKLIGKVYFAVFIAALAIGLILLPIYLVEKYDNSLQYFWYLAIVPLIIAIVIYKADQ